METTGGQLVKFWEYAVEKGLVNRNTGQSYRTACAQVMAVEDGWENLDVAAIDPDALFNRFQNLRKQDFTPASLKVYKRRFRTALTSFLEYQKDPSSWKPPMQERAAAPQNGKRAENGRAEAAAPVAVPAQSATAAVPGGNRLVGYPFPLRGDRIVQLSLPSDLTTAEVKRLTRFMESLVVEPEPTA